jgi:hypothetical protein
MLSDICYENYLSTIEHALHGATNRFAVIDYIKVSILFSSKKKSF